VTKNFRDNFAVNLLNMARPHILTLVEKKGEDEREFFSLRTSVKEQLSLNCFDGGGGGGG
jgi:hypothetical protein